MTSFEDSFEGSFDGIDGPRPLPDELREGLLATPAELDAAAALQAVESTVASRPLHAELRDRLLASSSETMFPLAARRALLRRFAGPQRQRRVAVVAAAAAMLLLAGTLAAAMEMGSRRPERESDLSAESVATTSPAAITAGEPAPVTGAPTPRPTTSTARPKVQGGQVQPAAPGPPPGLHAPDNCGRLLEHYRSYAMANPASYGPKAQPAAAPSPPEGIFATANAQEPGVDEADIVENDGKRLFLYQRVGTQLRSIRIGSGGELTQLDSDVLSDADAGDRRLLVAGDRVVVMGTSANRVDGTSRYRSETVVDVFDVRDPAAVRLVAVMRIEGRYVSAQLADGVVRLVAYSEPKGPDRAEPSDTSPEARARADEENKRRIAASTLDDWVPGYHLEDRSGPEPVVTKGRLFACDEMLAPERPVDLTHLTVLTVDPADPGRREAASVQGASPVTYASKDNLYVTTADSTAPDVTAIHRFSIGSRRRPAHEGTGTVSGTVPGRHAMSERDGLLRVATRDGYVSVLRPDGGRMMIAGRVGGLGRGQPVYAARFIGPLAFVITSLAIDRPQVVDVTDPARPTVAGDLDIEGHSAYLHPMNPTHLIGTGYNPGETGLRMGLQLSVFDVGNPSAPARTANQAMDPGRLSDPELRPDGFAYWAPTGTMVLPLGMYTSEARNHRTTNAVVLRATTTGFAEQARLTHEGRGGALDRSPDIRRSFVIGSSLYTFSWRGVLVSDVSSLTERQWLRL